MVCDSFKWLSLVSSCSSNHSWTPVPCPQLASPLLNLPESGHGVRVWEKEGLPGNPTLPNCINAAMLIQEVGVCFPRPWQCLCFSRPATRQSWAGLAPSWCCRKGSPGPFGLKGRVGGFGFLLDQKPRCQAGGQHSKPLVPAGISPASGYTLCFLQEAIKLTFMQLPVSYCPWFSHSGV